MLQILDSLEVAGDGEDACGPDVGLLGQGGPDVGLLGHGGQGGRGGRGGRGGGASGVRLRPLRRAAYELLHRHGAFDDEEVELVAGALVRVGDDDPDHDRVVAHAAAALRGAGGPRVRVDVGAPWALNDYTVVRPDLRVTTVGSHWDGTWRRSLLVIEVAGRTLAADRGLKRDLYAQAEVDEYWLVDLIGGVIEVWRDRDEHATWAPPHHARRGALVRHGRCRELALDLAGLLPLPWERSGLRPGRRAATPVP